MRTAVVRVVVDREGRLAPDEFDAGVRRLGGAGLKVIASPARHLPQRNRDVELVVEGFDEADAPTLLAACSEAFGIEAIAGVVTYTSRGTDEDARGILAAFGVSGRVEREETEEAEVLTVALTPAEAERVPEARLFTALQAALNCEVVIVVDDGRRAEGRRT
jgi:hypothetical protein